MSNVKALDPGTMFFQSAELVDNDVNIKIIRNAFVELLDTEDVEEILSRNNWHYVKDKTHYYVIGEDALKVARMFPGKVELRRPMQDGVLNKGEDKKMLIMSELVKSAIGKAPDEQSLVCTCVSSESVDGSADNSFHKARLMGMIENFGWNVKVIEEGLAVILSERPVIIEEDGTEIPYSGIGISFGSGRANCVLAYRGLSVIGMSAAYAGDRIDQQVALHTDTSISQVTTKKEKELDFDNLDLDDDIIFALDVYYEDMIKNVITHFSKKFKEVKSQFDAPLDIVVAGGTAAPKGFCNKLKKVLNKLELPFKIKEIRMAKDPRNAVVRGCLTQATVSQKKLVNSEGNKDKKIENKKGEKEIKNDPSEILGE